MTRPLHRLAALGAVAMLALPGCAQQSTSSSAAPTAAPSKPAARPPATTAPAAQAPAQPKPAAGFRLPPARSSWSSGRARCCDTGLAAVEKGDVAAAKAAYREYDARWNGIEVYVNVRSKALYGQIEVDNQHKIEEMLAEPQPNMAAILPLARDIGPKYDEAIKLSEAGPPLHALFDDVAAIRIVRAGLRPVSAAAKAGDMATAKAGFEAFAKGWPSVRELIAVRSLDGAREIDEALKKAQTAIQASSPNPAEIVPGRRRADGALQLRPQTGQQRRPQRRRRQGHVRSRRPDTGRRARRRRGQPAHQPQALGGRPVPAVGRGSEACERLLRDGHPAAQGEGRRGRASEGAGELHPARRQGRRRYRRARCQQGRSRSGRGSPTGARRPVLGRSEAPGIAGCAPTHAA